MKTLIWMLVVIFVILSIIAICPEFWGLCILCWFFNMIDKTIKVLSSLGETSSRRRNACG